MEADTEDIAIPTWEDWRRVSYWHDKRLFAKDYYTYPTVDELQSVPWHTRRPTAVWRVFDRSRFHDTG